LGHHTIALWAVPDLVEAGARAGQASAGRAALQRFSAWTQRTGAPWSLGVAHRAAALLAGGDVQRLIEAVAHHDDGRPLDRARTQLCSGEALRRDRRRIEARKELSAAVETFDRLGAEPWAERARSELRASGESVVRSADPLHVRLTPQELQISRLAARGASNLEIAAQLFVSRKTVEYHLHKVLTKLGITGLLELVKLRLD